VKLGVIGAGAVGSAVAIAVCMRGHACELVLLDKDAARAKGVATDLRYGVPLSPLVDVHAGGYDELADADLVIITAGINEKAGGATDRNDPLGRLRLLDANVKVFGDIVPRVTAVAPGATILILTTRTGGGHLNLAQSLKSILEPHYDVDIVNPQPGLVDDAWYSMVIRHLPLYLEWQYVLTDNALAALCIQQTQALLSRKQILELLDRYRPQLVIATHALLSYATSQAIRRSRKRIPLVFQLTDLGRLHMTWFSEKQAGAYLAPTREIAAQALERGIDSSRLHLTGRPVRRQFLEASPQERSHTLTALGFDPATFTVFLQGGADGSASIDRVIARTAPVDADHTVLRVAEPEAARW